MSELSEKTAAFVKSSAFQSIKTPAEQVQAFKAFQSKANPDFFNLPEEGQIDAAQSAIRFHAPSLGEKVVGAGKAVAETVGSIILPRATKQIVGPEEGKISKGTSFFTKAIRFQQDPFSFLTETEEESKQFDELIAKDKQGRIIAAVGRDIAELTGIFKVAGVAGRLLPKVTGSAFKTLVQTGESAVTLSTEAATLAKRAFFNKLGRGAIEDVTAGVLFGAINELESDKELDLVRNFVETPLTFAVLGVLLRGSPKLLEKFRPLFGKITPAILNDPLTINMAKEAQRTATALKNFIGGINNQEAVDLTLRAARGEVTAAESRVLMDFFVKNPEILSNDFTLQLARQLRPKLAPKFTVVEKGRLQVRFQDTVRRIEQEVSISPKNPNESVDLALRAGRGEILLQEVSGTEAQLLPFRKIFELRQKPLSPLEFRPVAKIPDALRPVVPEVPLPRQAEAGFARTGVGAPEPRKRVAEPTFVPTPTAAPPGQQRLILPRGKDILPTAAEITERKLGPQGRPIVAERLAPGEPRIGPPQQPDIVPGKQPVSPTGEVITPGPQPQPGATIEPGFAFTPRGEKVRIDAFGLPIDANLSEVQQLERQLFSSAMRDAIETAPVSRKTLAAKPKVEKAPKVAVSKAIEKRIKKLGGEVEDATADEITIKIGDRSVTISKKEGTTLKKIQEAIEKDRVVAPESITSKRTPAKRLPPSGSKVKSKTSSTEATVIEGGSGGTVAVRVGDKQGLTSVLEDGTIQTSLFEPLPSPTLRKGSFLVEEAKRHRAADAVANQFEVGAESSVRTKAGRKAKTFHDPELDTVTLVEAETGISTTIKRSDMMEAIRDGRILPTSEALTQLPLTDLAEVNAKLNSRLRGLKSNPRAMEQALEIREKMDDVITEFQRRTGRLNDSTPETSAFMERQYRKFLNGEIGEIGLGLCTP